MKNLLYKIKWTAACCLLWVSSLYAQELPISVQGIVRNSDGSVFSTGNYSVKFRIYTTATGGTHIWMEEQDGIRIEAGVYSALIGKTAPFGSIPFNQPLYLGVSVDGGNELSPRALFTAAPAARYALRSPGSIPTGMVVSYAGPLSKVPDGWLHCDGRALKSTDYATLFDRIGTTYGDGSSGLGAGSGTDFNLPDLRSEFIRGADRGRGVDANRVVGSFQDWATGVPANGFIVTLQSAGSHTHTLSSIISSNVGTAIGVQDSDGLIRDKTFTGIKGEFNASGDTFVDGAHTHTISITGGGDSETRPVNTAVYYFIKY